ncbi:hypothetical protein [Streptomyces sp. ME19-01-6]|uniref:hypothetical protein n=1 Tax=Streptomyces sp. ME19-01-6 TaxID=3028686 RepID=UPI0029A7EDB6|nr:hypothetical protein [Streptomyces sp. ME19-01-6]MDX3230936.1 hypothetical protein [Streptomyces sp. ME19-01-6]
MGAATRRSTRARPRPAAAWALALTLTAAATACAGPQSRPAPAPRTSANRPTAQATSPVRLCFDLISYWAEQDLLGSKWAGLDWEQKGLSNQQYEIYDDIVRSARAERKRRGTAAAKELIRQETLRRCTDERGATHSSENWRPPS